MKRKELAITSSPGIVLFTSYLIIACCKIALLLGPELNRDSPLTVSAGLLLSLLRGDGPVPLLLHLIGYVRAVWAGSFVPEQATVAIYSSQSEETIKAMMT